MHRTETHGHRHRKEHRYGTSRTGTGTGTGTRRGTGKDIIQQDATRTIIPMRVVPVQRSGNEEESMSSTDYRRGDQVKATAPDSQVEGVEL